MTGLLVGTAMGFGIGLVLGLLGGGGSILTVPALVYVSGQSPHAAVASSLAIVGANSTVGALFHRAQGTLNWRVALSFGGAGMATAFLAGRLSEAISATALLVLFALLMLTVGMLMIARRAPAESAAQVLHSPPVVVASGAGVGALTGLLGVGGGFLVVPALVMLVGLPMQQAVGTSLVIIAMNSLAGLAGRVGSIALDMQLVALFVAAGLAGTFAGARLGKRVAAGQLRRLFAVFSIALALLLLYDNFPDVMDYVKGYRDVY